MRESRVRDLGGLAAEMYQYGAWRSDLLEERCAELAGIDARIADIDALLGRRDALERCSCGAPLRENAEFCSNCGAPVEQRGLPGEDTVVEPRPRRGD